MDRQVSRQAGHYCITVSLPFLHATFAKYQNRGYGYIICYTISVRRVSYPPSARVSYCTARVILGTLMQFKGFDLVDVAGTCWKSMMLLVQY